MYANTGARRIWIGGHQVEVWDNPQGGFSWTPSAVQGYVTAGCWEAVFNALVLMGDSDPRGAA